MEAQRKALQMREEIPAQREDQALSDIAERARKIVGQEARNDSNQQCRGACAVEDLYPAKRGGVQPGMQERHAAWLMREYAINYDLRSEERRVGKECRTWRARRQWK